MKNFYKELKGNGKYTFKVRDRAIKKQSELEVSNRVRCVKAIHPNGRGNEPRNDGAFWDIVKLRRGYPLTGPKDTVPFSLPIKDSQKYIYFCTNCKLLVIATPQENPKDDLISYDMKIEVSISQFDEMVKMGKLTEYEKLLNEKYKELIEISEKEDEKFQPEFEKFLTKNGW